MYRLQSCSFFVAIVACIAMLSTSAVLMAQDFNSLSNPVKDGFETPERSAPTPKTGTVTQVPSSASTQTESSLEVDPTEPASAAAVPSTRVSDLLRRGGVLMIPIGICSLILLVFVFERFVSLRKGRIIPGPFVSRVLEQVRSGELNRESAISLCERNGSAIANVFKAGFSKWGRPSVEIEQAVLDEGERESNHLRRYLRLINGVATVCPLLGMLGTVLGMIHAFDAIAAADPSQAEPSMTIATGISQALLTTAAGLTVAIPALIAYLFFSGRADRHVMELDSLGMKVVNLVSAEAIALNQKSTPASKSKTRKAA